MAQVELWWPIKDIKFTPNQMAWLISYLPSLREGIYPPNPKGREVVESSTRPPAPNDARFCKPCDLAAEIEHRLEAAGLDGILVKAFYCWGEPLGTLAKYYNCDQGNISSRVERALQYISGWKRKTSPYYHWTKQVNYREMNTKKVFIANSKL